MTAALAAPGRLLACCLAALLLTSSTVLALQAPPADQASTLHVLDARTRLPLRDAVVRCQTEIVAATDADGMAVVPPCAGRLSVTADGYVSAQLPFPAPAAAEVTLDPDVTRLAETVDVTGTAAPPLDAGVPAQFAVSARDLEPFRGALLDDPLRAMQVLPGVATTDELRAELSVRGSPFRHVGIVIDEVKSQRLMHTVRGVEQTGSVALLNGDMVASGTLASGSYPQRYGNSLGAELVVRTRDGRTDRVHGRVMTSAIATTATADGPIGDRVTWIAAARRSYASWIVRRIDPDLSGTFDFQDAHAKMRVRLTPRQHVAVTWLAGASTYDERGRRSSTFAIDVGRNRTQMVSGVWQGTPTGSLLLSQRLSYISARFRNTNPTGRTLDEGREREVLARSALTWARPRMTVDASAAVERFSLNGEAVRFGGTTSGRAQPFSGRTSRAGGHLHVQTQPAAAVRVGAGVRADHVAGVGTAVSPWLQAALTPSAHWILQAGYGQHHQAPDLLQRAGPNAGTGLEMERARHLDAGIGWHHAHWSISAAVYQRRERAVLDTPGRDARLTADGVLRPGDPRAAWANALDGDARGIEVQARYARGGWLGWMSYARGRVRQTSTADATAFSSAFDQAHLFTAAGSARLGTGWDASATLRLASNWPYDGYYEGRGGRVFVSDRRNALRLPTYARVDLRLRRVLALPRGRLSIFAEAINVTNRRNVRQVTGSYNAATREVFRLSESQLPIIPSLGLAYEF